MKTYYHVAGNTEDEANQLGKVITECGRSTGGHWEGGNFVTDYEYNGKTYHVHFDWDLGVLDKIEEDE